MGFDASLKTGASVLTAAEEPAGGGPGTIDLITSSDASIVVTNPAGPTTDLKVAAAAKFPGFGTSPPLVSSTSSAGAASTAARSDHTHGSTVADWTLATLRYFACDTTNGNDANAGWSDVSQAAAGAVAVKTLSRLLAIIPRFGQGRAVRAAIAAGVYNSAADAQLTFDGFNGGGNGASFQSLMFIGTATNATAGAVAFAGDRNDTNFAGFTTATGMNVAGYNATAYSVDAEGTPTLTAQLNGGGAPGFAAAPARPVGCRIRFDVATATVALRNQMSAVILSSGGNALILSRALAANPAAGDVFYIEMPGVSGPATTYIGGSGPAPSVVNPLELIGLSLGTLGIDRSGVTIVGCEALGVNANESVAQFLDTFTDLRTGAGTIPQVSLRCTRISQFGGQFKALGMVTVSTTSAGYFWQDLESLLWERSSSASGWQKVGGTVSGGLNTVDTLGTNSSTAHGASCQVYGTSAVASPSLRCGGELAGPAYIGRIAYTNMAGNPCMRILGAGLSITLQGPSGSTGNTDVGLDLSPLGISGNTLGAMGCTIALVGTPSATGTAGDVRLPNGTIVTWASLLATGLSDIQGNRIISATGPTSITRFSGPLIGAVGAQLTYFSDAGPFAAEGNQTTPTRYPTSARLALRLRVTNLQNNSVNATTVTLYKNGAATAMQVSIPAGSAANVKFVDAAHPILFGDGDDYDLRGDDPAGDGGGGVNVSGGLEWAT